MIRGKVAFRSDWIFLAQYQKNFVSVLKQAQRCLQAWVSKIESAMNACRR
jgi:hypothetical protein